MQRNQPQKEDIYIKSLLDSIGSHNSQILTQLISFTADAKKEKYIYSFFEEMDVDNLIDDYVFFITSLWPYLNLKSQIKILKILAEKSAVDEVLIKVDQVDIGIVDCFLKHITGDYVNNCLVDGNFKSLANFLLCYWKYFNEDNKELIAKHLIHVNSHTNEVLLLISLSNNEQGIIVDFFDRATEYRSEKQVVLSFITSLYPQLDEKFRNQFALNLLRWDDLLLGYSWVQAVLTSLESQPHFDLYFSEIVLAALERFNIQLLHLFSRSRLGFHDILFDLGLLSTEQATWIDELSDKELPEDKIAAISRYIPQFTDGFGKIGFYGALLTCAQLSDRKQYSFKCTVIDLSADFTLYSKDCLGDLGSFFATLKESNRPLKEKFVLTDYHWHAGELIIDENLGASLFLIDSMGESSQYLPYDIEKIFFSVFPKGNFYLAKEKRQYSEEGCSAMALDDCIHLFSIENYLDKKYEKTGLLGYLKDNAQASKANPSIQVVPLPLPFLRTTQSSSIFAYISDMPAVAKKQRLSKSSMNIMDSLDADFLPTDSGKKMNRRLQNKLDKMACYNRNYLFSHPDLNRLEDDMKLFTMDGFRDRYKQIK